MRSNRLPIGRFQRAAFLDREIGNAPRRIQHARSEDRLRRAGIQAQRARPALIDGRGVHFERQAADDLAEEDPGAERRVDDAGVLADPADARVPREDALLHRPRVDVGARVEWLGGCVAHPREQRLESRADDVVVVVAPGVARNLRAATVLVFGRVRAIGVVYGRCDDDRLSGGHDLADVDALLRRAVQVRHRAAVPAGEPLAKKMQFPMVRGGRHSARVKAERAGVRLDRG